MGDKKRIASHRNTSSLASFFCASVIGTSRALLPRLYCGLTALPGTDAIDVRGNVVKMAVSCSPPSLPYPSEEFIFTFRTAARAGEEKVLYLQKYVIGGSPNEPLSGDRRSEYERADVRIARPCVCHRAYASACVCTDTSVMANGASGLEAIPVRPEESERVKTAIRQTQQRGRRLSGSDGVFNHRVPPLTLHASPPTIYGMQQCQVDVIMCE